MKVSTRPVKLDMLSASKGGRKLLICTHRENIHLYVWKEGTKEYSASHEFTFDQFCNLLEQLRDGIAEAVIIP